MPEAKEKRVAIYVSEDLHREARKRAAAEDTSFQQVLHPLFERWARGDREVPTAAPRSVPQDDRWTTIARWVMARGSSASPETRALIQNALILAEREMTAAAVEDAKRKIR